MVLVSFRYKAASRAQNLSGLFSIHREAASLPGENYYLKQSSALRHYVVVLMESCRATLIHPVTVARTILFFSRFCYLSILQKNMWQWVSFVATNVKQMISARHFLFDLHRFHSVHNPRH